MEQWQFGNSDCLSFWNFSGSLPQPLEKQPCQCSPLIHLIPENRPATLELPPTPTDASAQPLSPCWLAPERIIAARIDFAEEKKLPESPRMRKPRRRSIQREHPPTDDLLSPTSTKKQRTQVQQ